MRTDDRDDVKKKPVVTCSMAARCPLNGRICECCINREEFFEMQQLIPVVFDDIEVGQ